MYSLRLSIVVLQTTLFTTMFTVIIVVCSLKSMCIYAKFRLVCE